MTQKSATKTKQAAPAPRRESENGRAAPFPNRRRAMESILEAIGGTPLIRLRKVAPPEGARLFAKVEMLNPGGSVKDRIGIRMIEVAERDGRLRPGGTIVEPTAGNTGVGLAIAAAVKGYRAIFVVPDKMSEEKIHLLKAYGAEVVVVPTVSAGDPRSYYSVAERLAREIPGAFQPNQFANPANPEAHYLTTGPEIWEQTGGPRGRLRGRHRHWRHDQRHVPGAQGAQPQDHDRRRGPRGLDLFRRLPRLLQGGRDR